MRKIHAIGSIVKFLSHSSLTLSHPFLKSQALSFLEKQEADYRSGGQGGMWKKGKEKAKMR